MKVTDYILIKIYRKPKEYVFTYGDFTDEVDSKLQRPKLSCRNSIEAPFLIALVAKL